MESLGEFLQQVRQQRGITLEEVVSQTKISLRMLRALEANDFSQIPSEVFARGFVLSYARCLGLNEGDIFKKFRESASDFYAKISEREAHRKLPAQGPGRQRWAQNLIVGTAVIGVLALVGVAFYDRPSLFPMSSVQDSVLAPAGTVRGGVPPQAEADVGRHPVEKSVTFPVELTVNVPNLPPQKDPPPVSDRQAPSASSGEDLTLVVEASERSWVMAHIDEQLIKEVLLQPGEKVRWTAKTKIEITVGNAGGVKLVFNGKPLDPLGPIGKVVRNLILAK